MPFVKGQSGNPAGRPPGRRNRATLELEAMLDAEAPELFKQLIERAHDGEDWPMRFLLERLLPARRERPVPLRLPRIEVPDDAVRATAEITEAVGSGEVTPREAADLLRMIEGQSRALDVRADGTVAARLANLEGNVAAIGNALNEVIVNNNENTMAEPTQDAAA